jgi:hypothetical protein
MNPGPVQEGSKIAGNAIEALKSQPMTLAMVIFNCVFIGSVYFGIQNQRNQQAKLMEKMLEQSEKAQAMLFQCVPQSGLLQQQQLQQQMLQQQQMQQPPQQGYRLQSTEEESKPVILDGQGRPVILRKEE